MGMVLVKGEQYYTSKEVCELIGYSRSTLMDRVRDGKIKQVIHNGTAIFNKEEIDALKNSQDYLLYGDVTEVLVTVKELAGWMGKSTDTIYTWLRHGKIKATRVGRFVFFTKDDINRILVQMRRKISERPQVVKEQFEFNNSRSSHLDDRKMTANNK